MAVVVVVVVLIFKGVVSLRSWLAFASLRGDDSFARLLYRESVNYETRALQRHDAFLVCIGPTR